MILAKSGSASTRRMLGSGTIYAVATVAPILSTLLITPVVTRLLGPSEYGLVGISITLYQLGSVALSLGLPFAITRHAIIARSGVRGAVALVAIGSLTATLGGVILTLLLPLWGPLILGTSDATILFWPVVSSVGLCILTLSQSVLRAVDRVAAFVVLSCVAAIFGPLAGLLSVFLLGSHASSYLEGLAIGHSIAGLAALSVVFVQARPDYSWADVVENVRIGLPTLPHSIATALLTSALVVLASRLGSVEDAGRLQLALVLGTAPIVLLGAFNNSWAPMIYRAKDADRGGLLASSLRGIAILVFVLVGGFCTLAHPVVSFIAGSELFTDDLLRASITVTAAAPFMALYLANIHLVLLSGKTVPLAITTPASLVVSAILVGTVIQLFGTPILATLALGVPLFYVFQWIASSFLSRMSGYDPPMIGRSLPILGMSLASTILVTIFLPAFTVTACAFIAACLVILFTLRSSIPIKSR